MKKFLLVFSFLAIYAFPQEEIDKIVAIVDNEIILMSELKFQTALFAAQRKIDASTPGLEKQVLNLLIEDKLIFAQAGIDSIVVTEDEVTRQIEYQINTFIQQYGSKEAVEEMYGMPIEKMKRELRDDVKKNLMVQRLQEKKFGQIESSRKEVVDFFDKYKDSLGIIPEKVKISHIYRDPKNNPGLKEKYKRIAEQLLDSIKNGIDFSELAKKYSEDPGSATKGGDLGFVRKGVFFPEFEAAAYALKEGEISEVIESPAGFHIIQLMEKRGESIRARHILIRIKSDDESDLETIAYLTEIRDSIIRKFGSFSDYAKKYSNDKETAPFGGKLGMYYISQMDKQLLDGVSKLKEGEISYPRRLNYPGGDYGYHIIWLEQRIPQHKPDLEIDYTELKKFSDEYKKQQLYLSWIEELKSKIYWEIKI